MKSAVVFGTGITAIAAMREATLAGLDVLHVTDKLSDIACHSRYRKQSILLPLANGEKTLQALLKLPIEEPPALLWPSNDNQVEFVARHHHRLSSRFFIPIPAWDRLRVLVDKYQLYQLAYRLDIPAPQVVQGISAQKLAGAEISYPCIVKPKQSPEFFAAYGRKVHIAYTPEELEKFYRDAEQKGLDVMVSEIIPGDDDRIENYLTYRRSSGEFTGEMITRRIRQDPHGFGMATVVVTQPVDPTVREQSRKLLAASDFHGFAVIEWKRDARNETPTLIEVNPRAILSQRLVTRAGMNYASLIREDAEGQLVSDRSYQSGLYWIDRTRDRYQYRRCRKLPGFSYRRFFQPYWSRPESALPLLDDPGPWLAKTRQRLRDKLARHSAWIKECAGSKGHP